MTRGIEKKIYNTRSYLSLHEINENLSAENVALKNRMGRLTKEENSLFFSVNDSLNKQQYLHTSAEVIDNSINRQKNFFTINKGERQGIKVDMAVISANSVAGVIVGSGRSQAKPAAKLSLLLTIPPTPKIRVLIFRLI